MILENMQTKISSEDKDLYGIADQAFLVFYVSELTLKALLFRRQLLFGKWSVVWWNWLDLSIVATGVVDQWIVPFVARLTGGTNTSMIHQVVRHLRLLRLFRIFRLLKLIKIFFPHGHALGGGQQLPVFYAWGYCVQCFGLGCRARYTMEWVVFCRTVLVSDLFF
jgi:hypothetical protein